MWHYSYHRFETQQEFHQVFETLGWTQKPPSQEFDLPADVVIDIIGAVDILPNGNPVGKYQDNRYHVNMAWHGRDIPQELQASVVTPQSPSRRFA